MVVVVLAGDAEPAPAVEAGRGLERVEVEGELGRGAVEGGHGRLPSSRGVVDRAGEKQKGSKGKQREGEREEGAAG